LNESSIPSALDASNGGASLPCHVPRKKRFGNVSGMSSHLQCGRDVTNDESRTALAAELVATRSRNYMRRNRGTIRRINNN